MFSPSTIQDSVEYHKDETITHENLYLKTAFYDKKSNSTVIFNFHSLIMKYLDIIQKDYMEYIELTDLELTEYIFNPKKFCRLTYGTEELWSALLVINNMISITDFNKKKLKVFSPDILKLLEEIFVLEEREINLNKEYMGQIMKK